MNKIFICLVLLPLSSLQPHIASAQEPAGRLELYTTFIPEPVVINGKQSLYYELYVVNRSAGPVTLSALDIDDVTGKHTLVSLSAAALVSRMGIAHKQDNDSGTMLQAGDTAIVYLEILSDRLAGKRISHHLRYTPAPAKGSMSLRAAGGTFKVPGTIAAAFGSPLNAGPWVAIYDPSWTMGHRRVRYGVAGKTRIPGRHAIDFMLLDSLGHFAKDNSDSIINFFGYGMGVLAVADGEVSALRNDFSESATLTGHPDYPPEKGNR